MTTHLEIPELREGVDDDTENDVETDGCDEDEERSMEENKESETSERVFTRMTGKTLLNRNSSSIAEYFSC